MALARPLHIHMPHVHARRETTYKQATREETADQAVQLFVFFQVRRRAAPRAQGPRVKGPFGPLGAIGVIPKPFRVDGHYERIAITLFEIV